MSSPKLIAYKAIIDLCSMMQDVVKNPDAIKEASLAYAASVSMSAEEVVKREEALKTITKASEQETDLQKRKDEFQVFYNEQKDKLEKQSSQLTAFSQEANGKLAEAQSMMDSAILVKQNAETQVNVAKQMQGDNENKKTFLSNMAEILQKREDAIADRENVIVSRETTVTARENRLKEALS